MRSPYQVLVFPYFMSDNQVHYAIFKRKDAHYWQGIAGGGEEGESILDSAAREAWEEAGIPINSDYLKLDTVTSIPVEHVVGKFLWGEDVYVINEVAFGVKVTEQQLVLSHEHTEYRWTSYEEALALLKWDSNKTALWELNKLLTGNGGTSHGNE